MILGVTALTSDGLGGPVPEASLQHFAEILRSAVDAIISINALGRIESVNPATEKLFGHSASELIGQNVEILMPEPYRAEHDGYIRQYRHGGRKKIIGIGREVIGQRRDGSTFPMHLTVSEYEVDGKRHFAGIVHDLTAQKNAEADNTRQQILFEAIVDDAPQAIILADQNRKIFLANRAVERIFGYTEDDLAGQNSRLLYASDADYEQIWRSKTDSRGDAVRVECLRKSGEKFPAEVIATVVHGRDRSVLGHMRLIRDLTQQVHQEEILSRSQRMDALGQLTSGIAHDFNNLLSVVIGNLELAEDDPEIASESAQRALNAARMGARLTERLLGFSRQRKLAPVTLQLNDHVTSMIEILQHALGEDIELTTEFEEHIWPVRADPGEIENAILNLAINARDAMPRGGSLKIGTRNVRFAGDDHPDQLGLNPGDYVRVSMSDNGCGMPPEVVARAFEPFFTTKADGRGTGLGLASIYGFAKQSGGNATIYSEENRGTSVNIYLPSDETLARSIAPSAGIETTARVGGELVLVVEDNPDLWALTVERLKRLGYQIEEAENGPAALTKLERRRVEIIFSDVIMPGGLTGYELAALAREHYPDVKVLLTSGYGAEQAAEQDTTGSALKVLRKPYNLAELASALQELLQN